MVERNSARKAAGRTRALLDQAKDALSRYQEGPGQPAFATVSEIVCELLEASNAGVLSLAPGPPWRSAFQLWHRQTFDPERISGVFDRGDLSSVFSWNPASPDPSQRNRFVRPVHLLGSRRFRNFEVNRIVGSRLDQVRALVCDDDSMLAWFGAFRDEPFTPKEVEILDELVPALKQRLVLERQLYRAEVAEASLVATLEALSGAALIVDRTGTIHSANATARQHLDRAPGEWRFRITRTLEALAAGDSVRGVSATAVFLRGTPAAYLLLFRDPPRDLDQRLAKRTADWRLTPQQSRIVELVARGETNKTIAARLACSVRTVEHHVAAALMKARVQTRSELTVKFWRDDD